LQHGQPLSERVFPLVANRLTHPGSEHALAQWLEDYYVCSSSGSRWTAVWKQSRRVKVGFDQLKLWYQTLDDLLAQKKRVEKQVFLELRDLFSLQPDLVFYDITSTYFEGGGPAGLGRFGYSRDGKPRNRQIVIGVVMMDGWPVAHHVFAGNRLDQTTVMEVAGKEPGVRVFVVHSDEREEYERSMRELSMQRARKDLEALRAQVDKGEMKEPDKIGAAAATKLHRNHGHRYFAWDLRKGKFEFFEHPLNLAREKALEGKYVIQTEEPNLSAVEAVTAYKQLNEVERGFSHLKDLLELRPVYHRREERVEAHVFVAALALLLDRALEKTLRAAGSQLSSPFAWRALETMRCVEVELGTRRKRCVTRGNQHVAEVLKAAGVTELDPPAPPEDRPCLM
jgi:transposase